MPIQPVAPQRLYVQIAEQIRAMIGAGEVAPGARLPAERDLAQQLGVSRPSLREALIARGHRLRVLGPYSMSTGVVAVGVDPRSGTLRGGADVRRGR